MIVQSYTPERCAIGVAATRLHRFLPRGNWTSAAAAATRRSVASRASVYRHADEAICAREGNDLARLAALAAQHLGITDLDIIGADPLFAAEDARPLQWQVIIRSDDLDAIVRVLRVPDVDDRCRSGRRV